MNTEKDALTSRFAKIGSLSHSVGLVEDGFSDGCIGMERTDECSGLNVRVY